MCTLTCRPKLLGYEVLFVQSSERPEGTGLKFLEQHNKLLGVENSNLFKIESCAKMKISWGQLTRTIIKVYFIVHDSPCLTYSFVKCVWLATGKKQNTCCWICDGHYKHTDEHLLEFTLLISRNLTSTCIGRGRNWKWTLLTGALLQSFMHLGFPRPLSCFASKSRVIPATGFCLGSI